MHNLTNVKVTESDAKKKGKENNENKKKSITVYTMKAVRHEL